MGRAKRLGRQASAARRSPPRAGRGRRGCRRGRPARRVGRARPGRSPSDGTSARSPVGGSVTIATTCPAVHPVERADERLAQAVERGDGGRHVEIALADEPLGRLVGGRVHGIELQHPERGHDPADAGRVHGRLRAADGPAAGRLGVDRRDLGVVGRGQRPSGRQGTGMPPQDRRGEGLGGGRAARTRRDSRRRPSRRAAAWRRRSRRCGGPRRRPSRRSRARRSAAASRSVGSPAGSPGKVRARLRPSIGEDRRLATWAASWATGTSRRRPRNAATGESVGQGRGRRPRPRTRRRGRHRRPTGWDRLRDRPGRPARNPPSPSAEVAIRCRLGWVTMERFASCLQP